MAKASDLMGRSGAGGTGRVNPLVPVRGSVSGIAESKTPHKKTGSKPTVGHQQAGGGKAPVARRPKV